MHIQIILPAIFMAISIFLLFYAMRQRYWAKKLLANSFSGIITLIIADIFGKYVYIECSVNAFSLAFSTVFGIPGAVFAISFPIVQNL